MNKRVTELWISPQGLLLLSTREAANGPNTYVGLRNDVGFYMYAPLLKKHIKQLRYEKIDQWEE